jgi:hypothetical protein
MIIIGGEADSDMNDLWSYSFLTNSWTQPVIEGGACFIPKRFHSANTIQETKILTFGGCHSEYMHLNDLNLFDLTDFEKTGVITCVRI